MAWRWISSCDFLLCYYSEMLMTVNVFLGTYTLRTSSHPYPPSPPNKHQTHLCIKQLETYYNLTYTIISLIFLSPFVGYMLAAIINNPIHTRHGQRGIALLSTVPKVIAYTVICFHPPYPALVAMYLLVGFANGLEDAGWNSWVGAMRNANEVLGILHGCYGLGATVSPLVATAMVTKAGLAWYRFYYIMVRFPQCFHSLP